MVAPEVHVTDRSIHEALVNDANRPKLVETLPDWMKRESSVRFGDTDIALDETRLPRIDGFMGAAHLLRKGQAEFTHNTMAPANTPANKEQSGALLAVKAILEMAGLYGGAQAMKKGRGKNAWLFLGGLGLFAGSGVGLTMDLSGCGPQSIEAPPAIATDIPATAHPLETSTPSLGNEVLTGTPSAAPETPAPVGSVYPTEVSGMTDPKVYSYGGAEGRANMNEYTRALFDRYIAEMGPQRGGFLSGATVEELYNSFDAGYDFKLYTTDAGLVWLVQSKSDGSFLIPTNQDGQVFRDLQLSYDYMFQNGVAVPVGTDNFDFQRFSANRVGFVGAWPVLVSVDAQNVPVSWVNMEQGGATVPIVLASATSTPDTAPTPIPDSRVDLTVGPETFRVTTDVLYSEAVTNVNIDPTKAQKIGDILVYTDASGRLLWNERAAAWVPEFSTSLDYAHPETAPYVPLDAYEDGSAALSADLYIAEHPGLIEADASYPYYMVNLINQRGYEISLRPTNAVSFPESEVTQINRNVPKPYEYLGMQQTTDARGNVIYVIVKQNWNPGNQQDQYLPTFQGFDAAAFKDWIKYPLIFKHLSNQTDMNAELVPVFPAPPGSNVTPADAFSYDDQSKNPFVRALTQQAVINIFPQDIRALILEMYPRAGDNFDAVNNPKSIQLDQLPEELSRMILYTGIRSWR